MNELDALRAVIGVHETVDPFGFSTQIRMGGSFSFGGIERNFVSHR